MSKSEELTQLASQAEELVANLKTLNERIGNYGAARDELKVASKALLELSHELTQLTSQSHQILSKLEQLKMAELFAKLSEIHGELMIRMVELKSSFESLYMQQKRSQYISFGTIVLVIVIIVIVGRGLLR